MKLQSSFDRATAAADKARKRDAILGDHGNTGGLPECAEVSPRNTTCSEIVVHLGATFSGMIVDVHLLMGLYWPEHWTAALHCCVQGRSHPRDSFEMGRTSPPLLVEWLNPRFLDPQTC